LGVKRKQFSGAGKRGGIRSEGQKGRSRKPLTPPRERQVEVETIGNGNSFFKKKKKGTSDTINSWGERGEGKRPLA